MILVGSDRHLFTKWKENTNKSYELIWNDMFRISLPLTKIQLIKNGLLFLFQ